VLTPEKMHTQLHRHRAQIVVTHDFPEEWDEQKIATHRYDECPCNPTMRQTFCTCGNHHTGYSWRVVHREMP
jgi:hypothetical protein